MEVLSAGQAGLGEVFDLVICRRKGVPEGWIAAQAWAGRLVEEHVAKHEERGLTPEELSTARRAGQCAALGYAGARLAWERHQILTTEPFPVATEEFQIPVCEQVSELALAAAGRQ